MKKFLIFLILFTSIFIVGNANATTLDYSSSANATYENLKKGFDYYSIENYSPSSTNAKVRKKIIENKEYEEYGKYYIWTGASKFSDTYNFFITDFPEQIVVNTYANIHMAFKAYYDINKPVYYLNFTDSYGTYEIKQITEDSMISYTSGLTSYLWDEADYFEIGTNEFFRKLISSNIENLKLDEDISLIINDYTWNSGDILFYGSENGKISLTPQAPTISFSKTDNIEEVNGTELVTSSDLNVKFSIIDNEKYIYRYKILPNEEWTTMTLSENDNFDIHLTSNTSVVVEVLDLETKETVTSSTYTLDSISNIDVSISITKNDDVNCIANYNNTQVETCTNLNIYFSYINNDKYYYQYSIDNESSYINIDSDNIKNNIFNYVLNNEYLIVRVIDKTTKSVIASDTFTFSKFQENPTTPYINFEIFYNFTMCDSTGVACEDFELVTSKAFKEIIGEDAGSIDVIIKNMSATLGIKIYNFNENYHYYYSDNSGTYKEFTKANLKLSEYGYYYTAIETDFNIQITIDIYDENNNYLSSYTYTISEIIENTEEMNLEKMLEHIKSIFKNDNNIFDYFNAMYNKIRESKLGPYIYFIIISSIILLIINALQR